MVSGDTEGNIVFLENSQWKSVPHSATPSHHLSLYIYLIIMSLSLSLSVSAIYLSLSLTNATHTHTHTHTLPQVTGDPQRTDKEAEVCSRQGELQAPRPLPQPTGDKRHTLTRLEKRTQISKTCTTLVFILHIEQYVSYYAAQMYSNLKWNTHTHTSVIILYTKYILPCLVICGAVCCVQAPVKAITMMISDAVVLGSLRWGAKDANCHFSVEDADWATSDKPVVLGSDGCVRVFDSELKSCHSAINVLEMPGVLM